MYRKNKRTEQPLLLSDVADLSERSRDILKHSWADSFRREVFLRIPEDCFKGLYADQPSRPNVPANVLFGLELIKANYGWSDEECYEHFLFDLQVRYALGCDDFDDYNFDLRTWYYFRKRILEHALEKKENLYETVYRKITGGQIEKLGISTRLQRMDSTQLLSNIADQSRLELLVEAIQRLYRLLSESEQAVYAERLAPYIHKSAGQYTYPIRGKDAIWEHIQRVGEVLHGLLDQLAEPYHEDAVYQLAQRFFNENFHLVEQTATAKTNQEIQAGCLQSFDDVEATYREKGQHAYKGYVGNLSETCDPANPIQLITHVQVAPNRTSDIALLKEALPELKERTGLDVLVNDGAYVGPEIDQLMREYQITQIPTALTGTLPDHQDGKLAFSDFDLQLDQTGAITAATCPVGQAATIQPSKSGQTFRLVFPASACQACAFFQHGQCPVQLKPRQGEYAVSIPKDRASSSQRRRRFEQFKAEARNLRTAVEGTVYQVKHTWHGGKLPVRGLFRVTSVFICAALATNLRRINRYENDKQRGKFTSKKAREAQAPADFRFCQALWMPLCSSLAFL